MTTPSISPEEVAKTDHLDPPTNQPQPEPYQQLASTPSHASISSDHGSSTVMIASMTSRNDDEPKTDTSDFGVESIDSTVTIAMNSSSGSEGNLSSHSVVIEEPLISTPGEHKDDAESEASVNDAEETTTTAAVYGDSSIGDEIGDDEEKEKSIQTMSNIGDEFIDDDQEEKSKQTVSSMGNDLDDDEEEEKLIQTVSSILAQQGNVGSTGPERPEFNYDVPYPISFERGRHNEEPKAFIASPVRQHEGPAIPPDFYAHDNRPYPPVLPGEYSLHTTSAQHMMDVPRVTTLLPGDNGSEDVETLSRADFEEVDRRQGSFARDIMRDIEMAQASNAGQWAGTLNVQNASSGIQINFLGDQSVAGGIPVEQFMERFTNGQGMLQVQQAEAERKAALDAHHHARVANSYAESQGRRNGGIREQLKKVREGSVSSPEGTVASPPVSNKVAAKPPSKPKSKAAKVLALRAAKAASSRFPRPEVQAPIRRPSVSRGLSGKSTAENVGPTPVKTLVPSAENAVPSPTKFVPPMRTTAEVRPVRTYQRITADPRSFPGLLPAVANYSQASPLSQLEEEQDEFTGSETDADDEDAESGDSQHFARQSLQDAAAHQRTSQLVLEALCQALVTLLPVYQEAVARALKGHGTPTSETSDNDNVRLDSIRANVRLSEALHASEQLYGASDEVLHFVSSLLTRSEVINYLASATGDERTARQFVEAFLGDIWRILADDPEDDFDNSDGQYDTREADRGSSNDQPPEGDTANKDADQAIPISQAAPCLDQPFRIRGQGKMALDAILCDPQLEQNDATSAAHTATENKAKEDTGNTVNLEPWMIDTSLNPVKAKSKKPKRKKKVARGSDLAEAGAVAKSGKESRDIPKSSKSGLKASESITSVLTSDESAPEPVVRSPYATKNIFEQLKLIEDAKSARRTSPESAEVNKDKVAVEIALEQESTGKPVDVGQTGLNQDISFSAETQAPVDPEIGVLKTEAIRSRADCEVDPFKAPPTSGSLPLDTMPAHDRASAEADSAKAPASSGSVNVSTTRPLPSKGERGDPNRQSPSNQRLPSPPRTSDTGMKAAADGPGTSAVLQRDKRQPSTGRFPFPPGLAFKSQMPNPIHPNPIHHQGLSMKDIKDGATIELHPTKGTECIVLREPRERPDYSCTLFAAGVPYYNESIVPWQKLRTFIKDHFQKFGPLDNVKAVRDANATGHVNAFIAFQNRDAVDRIIDDPESCIISLPAKPNSYDDLSFPGPIIRRHKVEGELWMDVKLRLERAQGTRRVYLHLTGVPLEHATGSQRQDYTRSGPTMPSTVSFESYLDVFGQDKYGREKYRLRRRLQAPINPHDFEVNRRRDQTPYPHEASIEVQVDMSDEKESLRRLCEVFGELEEFRPWSESGNDGFEAIFYDRECAIRALHQIRLIPGALAFWSHDRRGPKIAAERRASLQTLPAPITPNPPLQNPFPARSSADQSIQAAPALPTTNQLKEEWPSLSKLCIPRKKCVELPVEHSRVTSPSPLQTLPTDVQLKSSTSASLSLAMTGVERKERDLSASAGHLEPAKTLGRPQPASYTLCKNPSQRQSIGLEDEDTECQSSAGVHRTNNASPVQDKSPRQTLATSITRPITPNVRMSPVPSGDAKMTILVEGLSKKEPEEEVKGRFRAYGRLESTASSVLMRYPSLPNFLQVDSTYTSFKKRATIQLSYNSIHNARRAVEAENGRDVGGRKQQVKFLPVPKIQPRRLPKNQKPKLPPPIDPSTAPTTQSLVVVNQVDRVTTKQSEEYLSPTELPDITARTNDIKKAVQPDGQDAEDSIARNGTVSNIPLSGRKRAFSDPGDVKRPSTAGTDRRIEILARENLQYPDSSTDAASALNEMVDQHLPPPMGQSFIPPQANSGAANASPTYMSPGQPMSLQGFSYEAPASSESTHYYSYNHAQARTTFSSGDTTSAFPGDGAREGRASTQVESRALATATDPSSADFAPGHIVDSRQSSIGSTGLRPYTFSQTEFGLTALYDPQELSKYRREHGLHVDTSAPPPLPSDEPPLALLPISSGGHSPTRSAFASVAPNLIAMAPQYPPDMPAMYGQMSQQEEGEHIGNSARSDEAQNQDLYPLYLQNANAQYYGYGIPAYQMQLGSEQYPRSDTEIQPGPAISYSSPQYASLNHITPSGNSAYRAPMQMEPTMARDSEQHDIGALQGFPSGYQATMISQLAGYGYAGATSEDQISITSAPGQQDARYYNQAPYGYQHPDAAQYQGHLGLPVVFPPPLVASTMYPLTGPFVPPATLAPPGLPSPGDDFVRTAQQQRSMGMPQDRQVPRPAESFHHGSVPATARVGRNRSLPTQSVMFQAAQGGASHLDMGAERSARGRPSPRKPRGATRGYKQPRGRLGQ